MRTAKRKPKPLIEKLPPELEKLMRWPLKKYLAILHHNFKEGTK